MRFERPVDEIVTRFPELRMHDRAQTVAYVSHEEIERAVALGRRLQARQVREAATTVIVEPLAGALRTAARAASSAIRAYRRDRARRATVRELHGLDDHQLRDIGLARSDIAHLARTLAEARHGGASEAPAAAGPVLADEAFEPRRAA